MPKYKQINTSEEGQVSSHIVSATRGRGEMKDSPLDLEGKTAWGTVDNNPASHFYMADWMTVGNIPILITKDLHSS